MGKPIAFCMIDCPSGRGSPDGSRWSSACRITPGLPGVQPKHNAVYSRTTTKTASTALPIHQTVASVEGLRKQTGIYLTAQSSRIVFKTATLAVFERMGALFFKEMEQ